VIRPDLDQPVPDSLERVHFVGIGGSGMSGIAAMMLDRGVVVSGSDRDESPYLPGLRERGATVAVGHDAANLGPADGPQVDAVVVTSALWADNPELVAARERGIPVLHRSQALAWLTRGRRTISVAGAHGKTTSTGMIVTALREVGADPDFVNGGIISSLKTSSGAGTDGTFVLEADESDRSFLLYDTAVALITNVDADHLDLYGTQEAFEDAFVQFASAASELVVASSDDAPTLAVLRRLAQEPGSPRVLTFGEAPDADVRIHDIVAGEGVEFSITTGGATHRGRIGVAGRHNAINAAGAVAVLVGLGHDAGAALAGLAAFGGTKRRFEFRGEARGVRVYDDYAHNPTEAEAAVAGARTVVGEGRVIALHQPHLYSRTRMRSAEFAEVYERLADYTVVVRIDGSREDPEPGVTGELVSNAFADPGRVAYRPDWDDAIAEVARVARAGDIVMTLSCGDIYRIVPGLLDALESSPESAAELRSTP
jgi:UDP-N-acetylmuramate--alanine ligase